MTWHFWSFCKQENYVILFSFCEIHPALTCENILGCRLAQMSNISKNDLLKLVKITYITNSTLIYCTWPWLLESSMAQFSEMAKGNETSL